MTVRQVFYQATVRGLIEKAETGYAKVQHDLTLMRRAGDLPYDWLADNTRWQRKPTTFNSVEDALRNTAAFYRKSLWADANCYVEIWLEKDALSGVIIYHLGDFDPSGVNAGEKIEETLCELAPDAEIHFERIAVTPDQIEGWDLPTRPTKASDTRAKSFGSISVELDAINPNALRGLVQAAIEQHLPQEQFAILKAAEQSERELISRLVGGLAS